MTTETTVHKCPECGYEAGNAQGLGAHRRAAHGIAGTTRRRQPEARNGEVREKSVAAVARAALRADTEWVEVVARVFPRGIQTADAEQLRADLGTIVALRSTIHENVK